MTLRAQILDYSRQDKIGALSPWFSEQLDNQIAAGRFHTPEDLGLISANIVDDLRAYRAQTGLENVVLGMSGGVDSALTAALFKAAGWNVLGVTLPINQNPEETARGHEAIDALGIHGDSIDLSTLYADALTAMVKIDKSIHDNDYKAKIRRGNIRARLRMITLYNLAAAYGGLVASTDNFSELAAGFWTLHGDVGDLSPIQSLYKSWEVPYISMLVGVPESTYRATPTDGLGIDNGDEAQLGATYLEWDIMINAVFAALESNPETENLEQLFPFMHFGDDGHAVTVFQSVLTRVKASWFKRKNPVNLKHMLDPTRYDDLAMLDSIFTPEVAR